MELRSHVAGELRGLSGLIGATESLERVQTEAPRLEHLRQEGALSRCPFYEHISFFYYNCVPIYLV